MPKMNGIDFLKLIKKRQPLKFLPVVTLNTSKSPGEIRDTFNLGTASYRVKEVDYK